MALTVVQRPRKARKHRLNRGRKRVRPDSSGRRVGATSHAAMIVAAGSSDSSRAVDLTKSEL
jgi:hypothetical protein